jgi:hypothetical protein
VRKHPVDLADLFSPGTGNARVPPGPWVQDVLITDAMGVALVIAGDKSKHLSLPGRRSS